MRTFVIIFSVVGLITFSSCKQEKDVQAMLENTETRSEIINTISKNQDYMTEFMDNDQTMQMMQGNQNMMGNMMKGNGTQMMMKDSTMMKNMMQSMMKDGKMMGDMMQMMHEKGMMSEDCMESCKNMMKEQGLDVIEQDEFELSENQIHGNHH